MTKYLGRLCLAALILSGSILIAACGTDSDKDALPSKSGNTSASASPAGATSSPTNGDANTIKHGPVGYIDRADCVALSGWVLNRDNPEVPVELELYADDKLQGKLKSGALFRKDLLDGKIGTGNYGFVYLIPANLKDGKPHSIKLKVGDYEVEFWQQTPRSITCSP